MFGWGRSWVQPRRQPDAPVQQAGAEAAFLAEEGVERLEAFGSSDLTPLLEAIEALAGRLYGEHGLPSQPGHYRRGEAEDDWSLVSPTLTPAEKFDLILAAPERTRPRYAAYDHLGAKHENAVVRQAAALFAASRGLRNRVSTGAPITAQTLADALRLGGLYHALAAEFDDPAAKTFINQVEADRDT